MDLGRQMSHLSRQNLRQFLETYIITFKNKYNFCRSINVLLFRETVAVYCENHTEHINTLCGQNAETLYIRIQFLPHRKHITSPLQRPTG
jgi:hypothetical protein